MPADMFFHPGDAFPAQPEPDAGPAPAPRPAAAERPAKPAPPRYREAPAEGGFAPNRQLVVTIPASFLSAPHHYAVDVINSGGGLAVLVQTKTPSDQITWLLVKVAVSVG